MKRSALLAAVTVACAGPTTAQGCDTTLQVPEGFCAQVMAEGLGSARHMAVAANGDVFVAVPSGDGAGVWVLRDTDGDGRADVQQRMIETSNANDVELVTQGDNAGWLYYSTTSTVVRHQWVPGHLEVGAAETVVSGLTSRRQHSAKTIVIGNDGMLYVNIGAPSNSCQVQDRQDRSPGQDPCPILAEAGGIWRFDANRIGQTQADGMHYASGIRNMVALALHPETGVLYGLQHGRDQLAQNWGYSDSAGAELPAEEFFRVHAGDDFGWPYCYYDPMQHRKVLNPEYGGDGSAIGRCADKKNPLIGFPGHWAPDGLVFYTGTTFPGSYRGGAFIAFHGSWNRAPLPQQGYNIVFVPFAGGVPSGDWTVFADGFQPQSRPVDVIVAPDGALLVSDDRGGRIFRITYQGGS